MNMLDLVDEMVIGGGMAYTFNKVNHGIDIGESLYDAEGAEIVPEIMRLAAEKGVKLHFPSDWVCGDRFGEDARIEIRTAHQGIGAGM